MSMLDAAVHAARETTYGTRAEPTRSFEAQQDPGQLEVQHLESEGLRAGIETLHHQRRRAVQLGAGGPLTFDVLTRGFGMLLRAAIGDAAIAQVGTTDAWEQTFNSVPDNIDESLTVQVERPPAIGNQVTWDYLGGAVPSWSFTQGEPPDSLLVCELTFDYQQELEQATPATPNYPAGLLFGWPDCTITIDGAAVEVQSFDITGDNNLKTDRHALRASNLKRQPAKQGKATYEGEISAEFDDATARDRFANGTVVPLVAKWERGEITAGTGDPFTLEITLPAVQFNGATPQVNVDDVTDQPMPFTVLRDPVETAAVTVKYISDDTAH